MENLSLLYIYVLLLVKRLDFLFFEYAECFVDYDFDNLLCKYGFCRFSCACFMFLLYSSPDMIIFFNCHDFQAAQYLGIQGLLDLTCQNHRN